VEIKNGQHRENGNIGHTKHRTKRNKKAKHNTICGNRNGHHNTELRM